jgi:hypothetical protein
MQGTTQVVREPVGVCGLITPWNWPANQIACKVAPALACGCTMVLKPSEIAPLSGHVMAEILHEAGVPAGVFNLTMGRGAQVGQALLTDRRVDAISFTGSVATGRRVAQQCIDVGLERQLALGLVRVEIAVRAFAHAPRQVHVQRQRRWHQSRWAVVVSGAGFAGQVVAVVVGVRHGLHR